MSLNKIKDKSHPLLRLKGVKKSFGDHQVLRGFDLELYPNENLVILGKSGSGKSVLIKCLVRLMDADAGEIEVLGQSINDLDHDKLDILSTEVGFLFQGSALYDSMTVRENLRFPLRRHPDKLKGRTEEELIIEALENVGPG